MMDTMHAAIRELLFNNSTSSGSCRERVTDKIMALFLHEIVEREAELIYLREHGADGAIWSANHSKDVWRDKAREAVSATENHVLEALKMVASKIRSGDDKPDDTFADFNGEETEQIFHAINR